MKIVFDDNKYKVIDYENALSLLVIDKYDNHEGVAICAVKSFVEHQIAQLRQREQELEKLKCQLKNTRDMIESIKNNESKNPAFERGQLDIIERVLNTLGGGE